MPHELAALAAFIKPTLLELSSKGSKAPLTDDQTMTTLQLISVFHSLDRKGENALGPEQVKQALILIGINPREKVMNRYFAPVVRVGEKPLSTQATRRSSQALEKVTKRFEVPKAIDMNKFIETTLSELETKQFDYDFATLFALMEAQETLPLKDLKHLLVGTKSPLKLSLKEFDGILAALEVDPKARKSLEGHVNCQELIAQLLLPQQLLMQPAAF